MLKNNLKQKLGACIALLYTLFSFWSCDPDFADKDYLPAQYQSDETIVVTDETTTLSQQLSLSVNKGEWRLIQYPEWLDPLVMTGKVNSDYTMYFSAEILHWWFDANYYFPETTLIFSVDGVGLVYFNIVYQKKELTTISLSPQTLTLNGAGSGYFKLTNSGDKNLDWKITGKPDWLTVEVTSGIYSPYGTADLFYSVSTEGLEPGEYQDEIIFEWNGYAVYHYPVVLTVAAVASPGDYSEGELVGSVFLKTTNQLVVLSKNPNRLNVYSAGNEDAEVAELDRVPRCIALSDDSNTIAVGFSNTEISTFDASSKTLKDTWELDEVPTSLAYGSGDYLYFLSGDGYYNQFINSLNLNTGAVATASNAESGIQELKRVPGQPVLVTTKPGWSPSYLFFIFNTDQGAVNDVNEYRISPSGLWPAEAGDRIFTGSKIVYDLPAYIPDQPWSPDDHPAVDGEFELPDGHYVLAIADLENQEKMFVSTRYSSYNEHTYVYVFNSSTFVQLASYEFSSIPPAGWPQSSSWREETSAIYPFSDASKLWLVQEFPANNYNDPDIWGVRLLDLN